MAQSPPDAMLIAMLSTLALRRAARRVRERRRAVDQPRAGSRARDGAASRHRRRTRTAGPPTGDREPADRVAGGVLGLGVGYAGMTLFRQIEMPTDLPDPAVVPAGSARAGLQPRRRRGERGAVRPRAGDPGDAHRSDRRDEGRRHRGAGRRRRWGRAVLVGGQVAVSVVLLVVAMFMYRGFREQLASGPGYPHRSPADDGLRHDA